MTTLEDFFVNGEDVSIDDDVQLIGNTRIIGGSLTVTGKITLDHNDETHANLIIESGDLKALQISLSPSKHCDTISVKGSIYIEDGIYLDGCDINAYNIYTKLLYAKEAKVLHDIQFEMGSLSKLDCKRNCYITQLCEFENGLTVAGKFQCCGVNPHDLLIVEF